MGFVPSLFGATSGNAGGAGMNFQASGADPQQLRDANSNIGGAIDAQRAFVDALNAQMAGTGPNPVQQQFQNNTNQLAAQQAGAISSQKGINPALAARMIAMQGGAAQQNAAGQAALAQAQQQLGTQGVLGQALNTYGSTALGHQSNLLGLESSRNSANAGVAQGVAEQQGKMFSNITDKGSKALGMPMANGGVVEGPASAFGKHCYKGGGVVPGGAPVAGDSPKNDVVPAMLSPKEVVLPRSITLSEDAPQKAAAFVAALMAQNKLRAK